MTFMLRSSNITVGTCRVTLDVDPGAERRGLLVQALDALHEADELAPRSAADRVEGWRNIAQSEAMLFWIVQARGPGGQGR